MERLYKRVGDLSLEGNFSDALNENSYNEGRLYLRQHFPNLGEDYFKEVKEVLRSKGEDFPDLGIDVFFEIPPEMMANGTYFKLISDVSTPAVVPGRIQFKNGKLHKGFLEYRIDSSIGQNLELVKRTTHEGALVFYNDGIIKTTRPEFAEKIGTDYKEIFPYKHKPNIPLIQGKKPDWKLFNPKFEEPFIIPYNELPLETLETSEVRKINWSKRRANGNSLVKLILGQIPRNKGIVFVPGDLTFADGDKMKVLLEVNPSWMSDNLVESFYVPTEDGFVQGTEKVAWDILGKTREEIFPFDYELAVPVKE